MKDDFCPNCNQKIENGFNFCPFCGEALNEIAKEVVVKQNTVAQLKLLNLLIDKVKDKKTLELLEKLTTMYKNN